MGGGGEVGLNKCLYGEAPPRGPTPYPFIYHFSGKRYPFRIPSYAVQWDRMDRFSFSSVLEGTYFPEKIADLPCLLLCIPFNLCKYTIFYIGINHKHKTFS